MLQIAQKEYCENTGTSYDLPVICQLSQTDAKLHTWQAVQAVWLKVHQMTIKVWLLTYQVEDEFSRKDIHSSINWSKVAHLLLDWPIPGLADFHKPTIKEKNIFLVEDT